MVQQPLRIHDAAEDPPYILDDQFRHSELSVPIVFEGRVLAVIDSEHTEIGFFSAQDEAFLLANCDNLQLPGHRRYNLASIRDNEKYFFRGMFIHSRLDPVLSRSF